VRPPRSPNCLGPSLSVVRRTGSEWEQCESELLRAGSAIPLYHRFAWTKLFGEPDSFFLSAQDGAGKCQGGVAVAVARSRVLPKHLLLRVQRCVPIEVEGALEATFTALTELARQNSRVLRVNIELFSRDDGFRKTAGELLAALGFRPASTPRVYRNTVCVDLSPPEDSIFSQLNQRARRGIRAINKHPLEIRAIADPALGDRMESIRKATCDRHGGTFLARDWGKVISFCRENPTLARLVGLFRTDGVGPNALLAFNWVLHHGDHAEYYIGASVRDDGNSCPLGYGLMWDLICWAKRLGAVWFDMGGVTPGTFGDKNDVLGGISDFKRTFSKTMVQINDEWELEPHPIRAKVARLFSFAARAFRRR
jgi:hypothetical protein